jgi:predicted DNA-binding transcriptional regulator YafY
MQNAVLFGMLLTLLSKKKVSAREFSIKYEISTRTVYRYVETLCGAGVPIYGISGKAGGLSITDNFKLDKTYFTGEEMARLISSVKSMSTAFKDNLSQSILDKLIALDNCREVQYILKSEQLLIDSGSWGLKSFKDKMNAVEKAITDTRVITIEYHSRKGEITTREIEPHTLVLKEGIWYVYAYCALRADFRLFKIGRIKNIIIGEKHFARKPLDVENSPYNLSWYKEENTVDIILEVGEKARFDVEEWLGVECVKQNSRGQYYAYAKVPDDSGLLFKLMSFGSNIKVIEPKGLIDMIKSDCAEILELYK